jgi:hypothetical protein
MRYSEILSEVPTLRRAARAHAARCPIHRAGVSRRQFLQGAAGLTAVAATFGSSVPRVEGAPASPGIGLVTPIPTTLTIAGEEFHVQAPPFTGVDSDPSSVYDFQGAVGLAFISGSILRKLRESSEVSFEVTCRSPSRLRRRPLLSQQTMRLFIASVQARDARDHGGNFLLC